MSVSVGTLFFVEQAVYKAQKALVAAKFNGLSLDTKKFDPQKDARKPDFLAKNPTGKVPFLETDMGCIFSSNAIAKYVATCREDRALYGKCFDDECLIDTWTEFCTQELEVPLMCWVYPTMGLMESDSKATSEAQADVKKALGVLEEQLKKSSFLIGDFLTLADIVLVCSLREGFSRVFDSAFRKPFPKVTEWFEKCCKMPQFSSVFGEVKLCSSAQKPIAVLKEFLPPARGEKKPQQQQQQAPAAKKEAKSVPPAAAAKAAAAPAPGGGGDADAKIKAVGDEIRTLKEKLKAEGLSGKKINDHEEVKKLVAQLQALKEGAPAAAAAPAPAAAPAAPAAGGDADAKIKSVGDEIRALKEKLKAEGLSGKKINDHDEVKKLVAQLQALKEGAPAAAAAPLPTPPPAAAGGGDLDAQIKAVGDEIRSLKEKLKAEGLSGKKINDHAEVKTLVAKLTELKAKA